MGTAANSTPGDAKFIRSRCDEELRFSDCGCPHGGCLGRVCVAIDRRDGCTPRLWRRKYRCYGLVRLRLVSRTEALPSGEFGPLPTPYCSVEGQASLLTPCPIPDCFRLRYLGFEGGSLASAANWNDYFAALLRWNITFAAVKAAPRGISGEHICAEYAHTPEQPPVGAVLS
jgi:hypothetical protein